MKLSNAANVALIASANAVAAPYSALAASLATALAGLKKDADTLTGEKTKVWDAFKSACAIGKKAKHDRDALRAGLEIACVQAGIPAGSFRGYISTVESLYADVLAYAPANGDEPQKGLTLEQVKEISVKDARERYMDAGKKALAEAKARLTKAVGEWSADAIIELAKVAEAANAKAAAAKPAEKSGEKVGPEKKAATPRKRKAA